MSPTNQSRRLQMLVHQLQRRIPGLALARHLQPLQVVQILRPKQAHPEAQRRDIGLVIVLLPEHPVQHVGMVERVGRDQARPFGDDNSRRRCFPG